MNKRLILLDCTLRDGGYYNDWDFPSELIDQYLHAMQAIEADFVEIGFRSLKKSGFKGGCAYSTDTFIRTLNVPPGLKLGVMVNASELVNYPGGCPAALEKLFTPASESPVTLVRLACHLHEFEQALPASHWLKQQGYSVGFNLMQVSDRTREEISNLAGMASRYPVDVLYFADSMGSMSPGQTLDIVSALRSGWPGPLGIHTHDNMGHALANCKAAIEAGVTWIDGTVTGMGRGPGNVKTEYLTLELAEQRSATVNITPLLALIRKYFGPMQAEYGWGSNPYYYLTGKYSIHPSYVQEMLADTRYSEEDILAAIEHLKADGGKSFNLSTLEATRHFYKADVKGSWEPATLIAGKEVLILGAGPGVGRHRKAIESYILQHRPLVIALNTQTEIDPSLIDLRAACHPMRLIADCQEHSRLPQPLVLPVSMLPDDVRNALHKDNLLDFGLMVAADRFEFHPDYAVVPGSLVVCYALAIATSGKARNILLAGFDGFAAGDPRRQEVDAVFHLYQQAAGALPLLSITATLYEIPATSVYANIN